MKGSRDSDVLRNAFSGKRVLITGHTGFKGGWLTYWLASIGAQVSGYAQAPDTTPAIFDVLRLADICEHHLGDIRDREKVESIVASTRPDFIFHMAAQPLVRRSYLEPLETIETNVLGTANLLEAVRRTGQPCVVVVVTSDKCYENREGSFAFRETDPLGGYDIYSMSKAAAELVVRSYRNSFFPVASIDRHGVRIATARAGNVIGGGDWAADRIVPDCIRSLGRGEPIAVRNPLAIRPWQHVLEPLSGYLALARALAGEHAERYCDAWNLGPVSFEARTVKDLVTEVINAWGSGDWEDVSDSSAPHESSTLRLSIDKAVSELHWKPRWSFEESCRRTVSWYRAHSEGPSSSGMRELTDSQIGEYLTDN
jgi:CDP-glucose 4,6-dehydratase